MLKEINTMVRCQHPLDNVCDSSEDVRRRLKNKRKSHAHIIFIPSLHTQQWAIQQMNSYIVIGASYIKLCQ